MSANTRSVADPGGLQGFCGSLFFLQGHIIIVGHVAITHARALGFVKLSATSGTSFQLSRSATVGGCSL